MEIETHFTDNITASIVTATFTIRKSHTRATIIFELVITPQRDQTHTFLPLFRTTICTTPEIKKTFDSLQEYQEKISIFRRLSKDSRRFL